MKESKEKPQDPGSFFLSQSFSFLTSSLGNIVHRRCSILQVLLQTKPRTPIQKEMKVQNPKQAICVRGGSAWRALQLPEDREPTIDFLLRHVKRPMLNHVASRQMCRRVVWRKQEGTKKRRAWSSGSWENQAHGHGSLWRAPAGWASGDM